MKSHLKTTLAIITAVGVSSIFSACKFGSKPSVKSKSKYSDSEQSESILLTLTNDAIEAVLNGSTSKQLTVNQMEIVNVENGSASESLDSDSIAIAQISYSVHADIKDSTTAKKCQGTVGINDTGSLLTCTVDNSSKKEDEKKDENSKDKDSIPDSSKSTSYCLCYAQYMPDPDREPKKVHLKGTSKSECSEHINTELQFATTSGSSETYRVFQCILQTQ